MTRAPVIPPFDGLTDRKLRSLGQKLDKLGDPNGYKQRTLLRKSADRWSALVLHQARHGRVAAPMQSAGLLSVLAEELDGEVSAADAIAVLRRLPEDLGTLDKGKARAWTMLTPGMLADVDRLVVHAYVGDRAAVLAIREEVGANLRLAIDFVRRRAGEEISQDSADAIFKHLAEHHCEHGLALNVDVPRIFDGVAVECRLVDSAAVRQLALLFGAEAAWGDAQLEWLLPRVREFRALADNLSERAFAGLVRAELSDLMYLFGDGYWTGEVLLRVLDARGDAPERLFAVAGELVSEGLGSLRVAAVQVPERRSPRGGEDDEDDGDEDYDERDDEDYDDYDGGDEESDEEDDVDAEEPGPDDDRVRGLAEALTIVGIERSAGEVARELDEHLELRRVYESEPLYVSRLRGVLTRLGPARTHAVVRRVLARPFMYGHAAAIADVHLDAGVVGEIFDRVDAGDYGIDARLLGLCGPEIVPLLAMRASNSNPKSAAGYREAILYVLARAAAAGHDWDPAWDGHVHLEQVRFPHGDVERILAMLQGLPLARYEVIVRTNIGRCAEEPWRLVRFLRADVSEGLLAEMIKAVLARHRTITAGTLGDRLRALGTRVVAPLLRAFGETPAESTLMRELERALAPAAFEMVKAGLDRPIETSEQEFRRLADALPGPKIRVYRLRRGDSPPAADAVARIFGQPRGVVSPPRHAGEPMQHVITLDLAQVPELAARHPGIRSLSLYVPDPDDAEEHEEGTIVLTHEDELGRAAGAIEGATALLVEGFEVPEALFERHAEGDLRRVRQLLHAWSGHVRGGPLWLQEGDEGVDPGFVMQFDEGLCRINLGDMGVMYVFDSGVTWQCH